MNRWILCFLVNIMKAEIIFSSFQLKKHTLKNRPGVAPMTRMSSQRNSIPRQDVPDFLVRRAENGAAIDYTEAIITDYESVQGFPGQSRILNQRRIDARSVVTEKIRKYGAMPIMQMFHCDRMACPEVNPAGRSIAPSRNTPKQNNPITGKPYPDPDPMGQFDIDHVIAGFVETARGAIAAGFDGIEIHGVNGCLINQFLSSYSNKRTDSYGGSPENRFRFARDVVKAVRSVVPTDRLPVFRISNWGVADSEVSLFENAEEWKIIIQLLSGEPLDALSFLTYNFAAIAFDTDKTLAQLPREVTDLPLMICGQIYNQQNFHCFSGNNQEVQA